MPSNAKIELKNRYLSLLEGHSDFLLTRYQGATVEVLSELRASLREFGLRYHVVKNRILLKAFEDFYGKEISLDYSVLVEPIGVIFPGDVLLATTKKIDQISKKHEMLSVFGGVLEGRYFSETEVDFVLSLPTREEAFATIGASLNSPAIKIAGIMQNIVASLARGITSVGDKEE